MDFGRRPAPAAANILPKTGQTTSYVDYDDGYHEKGWDFGERFTDNGDGTITDNATGLMWPKDLAGAGAKIDAAVAWQGAIDFAEESEFAGYDDWRLPNLLELRSINDHEKAGPCLYSEFDNVPHDFLWSSTSDAAGTDYAAALDLWEARLKFWNKTWAISFVLPVRTA